MELIVGTYPTYAEATMVAEEKGVFFHGFIGIRKTKGGYQVYCSPC